MRPKRLIPFLLLAAIAASAIAISPPPAPFAALLLNEHVPFLALLKVGGRWRIASEFFTAYPLTAAQR